MHKNLKEMKKNNIFQETETDADKEMRSKTNLNYLYLLFFVTLLYYCVCKFFVLCTKHIVDFS